MAQLRAIGDDGRGPVAESLPRESGASLYILVQIQAGPPRFALTGYAWRSHARPAGPSVSGGAGAKRKRRRTGAPPKRPARPRAGRKIPEFSGGWGLFGPFAGAEICLKTTPPPRVTS